MSTKYIFITGGVVSGLGKGIAAASIGALLEARGFKVTLQKFDPYINVDPGTMSPFQHGEVYVTDDGAETDLDLGHYERFIDRSLSQVNNVTTGRIYLSVITKELIRSYDKNQEDEANWLSASLLLPRPALVAHRSRRTPAEILGDRTQRPAIRQRD